MSNTSATGGTLPPSQTPLTFVGAPGPIAWIGAGGPLVFYGPDTPAPLDDDGLDDFLQSLVAGVTGLAGSRVRPRWQPTDPNLPQSGDWAAVGIVSRSADTFAVVQHDGVADGVDRFQRHEILSVMCGFYGPHSASNAARLRDGLQVAQNREVLLLNAMGLIDVSDFTKAPTLVKSVWLSRTDMTFRLKRQIRRDYPVLNILSSGGVIYSDEVSVVFNA